MLVFLSIICVVISKITCVYISGEWSLFDFVDPPRNLALRAADRVLDDQEPDVLKIHLEQFLLPALPADPAVYLSPLSLSGGSGVAAPEKKPTRIKITRRKYMASGAAPSSAGVTAFTRGNNSTTTEITSPTHVTKKRKFVAPTLTAFEAVQAAYALPLGMCFFLRMIIVYYELRVAKTRLQYRYY
ncbi:hypothetical protein HanRHA438_Chr17g0840211 [Helianthus annuus]|nr:hypothetical protein HanRHA438_Chr17g0840211 [Helianthus annuus]